MDLIVECSCGKPLRIVATNNYTECICVVTEKCEKCEKENYEAGEADAKQEWL